MNPVVKYFSAERAWCTIGAALALLSILVALWFFMRVKQPFQTGVAYPFLSLGIIFFTICLSVALRSQADISRVMTMIDNDLGSLRSIEVPRMNGVMRTFSIIIVIEITFVCTSAALLFFANLSPVWRGVMTGLLIQAGWLLIFDLFAQNRGREYANYLQGVVG
jgi:hypothetical protein